MNPTDEINGVDLLFGPSAGGVKKTQAAQSDEINGVDLLFGGQKPAQAKPESQPAPSNEWVVGRLYNAIKGRQDPAYKDVPAFDIGSFDTLKTFGSGARMKAEASRYSGADDKQLSEIIASGLGPNLKRTFKDANGYDIVEYVNDKGETKQGYINRPGLDFQDVGRTIKGAVPYVMGGAAVSGATKGAPMIMRGVAQGSAVGATSLVGDVASTGLGAEADLGESAKKAALTAAFGGAAEVLPAKAMATLAGGALGAYAQSTPESTWKEYSMGTGIGAAGGLALAALYQRMRLNPRPWFDDATGTLTPAGQKLAVEGGVNPQELSSFAQKEFAKEYALGRDASQAAIAARHTVGEARIPTTLGQRTKDYQQLLKEENMRAGNYGEAAKRELEAFDKQQRNVLADASLGTWEPTKPKGIGQDINPTNWGEYDPFKLYGPSTVAVSPGDRGSAIRSGLQSAEQTMKAEGRQRWDLVGDIYPTPEAAPMLTNILAQKVGKFGVTKETEPTAVAMLDLTQNWLAGKSRGGHELLGDTPSTIPFNDLRVQLSKLRRGVNAKEPGGADATAANAIYEGVNEWVTKANTAGLMQGPRSSPAAMAEATKFHAERKALFEPEGPAGNIMSRALDPKEAPERVVKGFTGDVTARSTPAAGTIEAISNAKQILTDKMMKARASSPEEAIRIAKQAQQTWQEIGSGYWDSLVTGKSGEILSPQQMLTNLKNAQQQQSSVMKELYPTPVLSKIKELERALEQVAAPHPNPSKSAIAGMAIVRDLAKTVANMVSNSRVMQAAAAPFMKPILEPVAGAYYGAVARRATAPAKQYLPSLGPGGAAAANTYERQR